MKWARQTGILRGGKSWPGHRLEFWLIAMALTVLGVPWIALFVIGGIVESTDSSVAMAIFQFIAFAYVYVGLPIAGATLITTLFLFIRKRLGNRES